MRERAQRAVATLAPYVVGASATLAVLWPALQSDVRDSFPLSTYPMFSRARGSLTLHAVVGRNAAGERRPLPPDLVGSGEVLQTKALVDRAVRGGRASLARLCREVAQRASRRGEPDLERVEIVRRRYDPVRYFENGAAPLEERALHGCAASAKPPGQAR